MMSSPGLGCCSETVKQNCPRGATSVPLLRGVISRQVCQELAKPREQLTDVNIFQVNCDRTEVVGATIRKIQSTLTTAHHRLH
ncbi:hypothetical protein E2C01_086774 [Portunus trituberculatus]|uniref:Uncharacterized protein n=1 Tax=Portunus trituberculatus TaxID=210409 RepID=A0A5B7JFJ4_PORTR|nr:hypothetical protein [Portunus trituberculatus]